MQAEYNQGNLVLNTTDLFFIINDNHYICQSHFSTLLHTTNEALKKGGMVEKTSGMECLDSTFLLNVFMPYNCFYSIATNAQH